MNRPLLILDLDETLIHGSLEPLGIASDIACGEYRIHKRPFVDEFIRTCVDAYTLAVWTSATEDYSHGIADALFADTPPAFVWARDRCIRRFDAELQESYWVKDLKKVKRAGFDLDRVLFVDDSREKLERNYGNLVLVSPFTGDPSDRELIALGAWLVGLAGEENLRKVAKRQWRNG